MCETTMTRLLLERIVHACVPEIGLGVDLTSDEGKLCTVLFRKSMDPGSDWEKRFNAADGAGTLQLRLPGCWNRVAALYLGTFNNENIENVQVDLALRCLQRVSESAETWAGRIDTILQSVDTVEKDKRVAGNLSALLLPGWLQSQMQTYMGQAQKRVEKVTYSAYIQELRRMAPQDPALLVAPGAPRRYTNQEGNPRSRFKSFRTPAEKDAFARVRVVEAREAGTEQTQASSACNKCHQVGHWARDCQSKGAQPPPPRQPQVVRPQGGLRPDGGGMRPDGGGRRPDGGGTNAGALLRKCNACGNTGHEARNCPRQAPAGRGRPPR